MRHRESLKGETTRHKLERPVGKSNLYRGRYLIPQSKGSALFLTLRAAFTPEKLPTPQAHVRPLRSRAARCAARRAERERSPLPQLLAAHAAARHGERRALATPNPLFSLLFLSAAVVLRQERAALYVPAAQLRRRGQARRRSALRRRGCSVAVGPSRSLRRGTAPLRSARGPRSTLAWVCGCIVCLTTSPLPRRLPQQRRGVNCRATLPSLPLLRHSAAR